MPQLWLRVGDAGEYESFGDSLEDVCDYLNDLGAGEVTGWVNGGVGIGFETQNFYGYDFVSLFWGDADAEPIRELDEEERAAVEDRLEESEL
jgi:hypothetical protein